MSPKKKRKRYDPVDPFQVFYSARAFHLSASVLDERPQKDFFMWPLIVCEALGLELHLKCLHILRGRRKVTFTHDIKDLFNRLSAADRCRIDSYLSVAVAPNPRYAAAIATDGLLSIDSILDRASDMFVKARYWHEGKLPRDSKGRASTAGIGPLSDATMKVILDLRPEWTEIKMKGTQFVNVTRT